MNYALIENNVIVNIISLSPVNADDFPNAINVNEYPVHIGDTYTDGKFYRDGVEVISYTERTAQDAQKALLSEMDEAYREGLTPYDKRRISEHHERTG